MNRTYRSALFAWLPLAIYCLAIFLLSSRPGPDVFPTFKHADKIVHVVAFTFLGILCFRAFWSPGDKRTVCRVMVLSLVFSMLFGICIELNQYFIPYRKAETMDIVADMLGSAIGIIVALMFYKKRAKN